MIRIVKMTFQEDKVKEFLGIFNQNKKHIRNFEGVEALSLLNDKNNPNIYFTYSTWKTEEHLNKYRNSALFNTVWNSTKVLFSEKAEVWSVEKVISL
jgi:heme-degrading monooxygenase HmoA